MYSERHICLYHDNCIDGLTSASVFTYWLTKQNAKKQAEDFALNYALPIDYNQSAIQVAKKAIDEEITGLTPQPHNTILWFVDYAPAYQEMLELANIYKKVVIIDHHESRIKEYKLEESKGIILPKNVETFFTKYKSGATFTSDILFGVDGLKKVNPTLHWFTKIAEDYDLFKFKKKETKLIIPYLKVTKAGIVDGFEFLRFILSLEDPLTKTTFLSKCASYKDIRKDLITKHVKQYAKFETLEVEELKVRIVLCPSDKDMVSDISLLLTEENSDPFEYKIDILVCFEDALIENDYRTRLHFRSFTNAVNAVDIAKQFGGGGHKAASGAILKTSESAQSVMEEVKTQVRNIIQASNKQKLLFSFEE